MLCVVTHRRNFTFGHHFEGGSQVASMYEYVYTSPWLASTRLLTISHQLHLILSYPLPANGIYTYFQSIQSIRLTPEPLRPNPRWKIVFQRCSIVICGREVGGIDHMSIIKTSRLIYCKKVKVSVKGWIWVWVWIWIRVGRRRSFEKGVSFFFLSFSYFSSLLDFNNTKKMRREKSMSWEKIIKIK